MKVLSLDQGVKKFKTPLITTSGAADAGSVVGLNAEGYLDQDLLERTFEAIANNVYSYPETLNYDLDGNLSSKVLDLGDSLSLTIAYNYSLEGNLTSKVLSGNLPEGVPNTKTYTYDGGGNLTSKIYSLVTGGLWTPAEITTGLWLDASDSSTITESGGAVSQWDDLSGNGNHMTGLGAEQPTTGVETINGLNVIDFDGNDDRFGSSYATSNSINVFVVRKSIDPFSLDFSGANKTSHYSLVYEENSTNTSINSAFGSPTYYKDGTQETISTRDTAFTLFNDGNPHLVEMIGANIASWGGVFDMQYTSSGSNYNTDGQYAEIVIVEDTITTDTRQRIEGYLHHKWNTPQLPMGHPYRDNPPTA